MKKIAKKKIKIDIKGEIKSGKDWFYDLIGVNYVDCAKIVKALEKDNGESDLDVYINSPGGSVFPSIEVFNTVKRLYQNKDVNVHVTGNAFSAAVIFMAMGKKVTMPSNTLVMIHDPLLGYVSGGVNIEKAKRMTDDLQKCKECIIDTLTQKVTIPKEELSNLMTKETYLTAEECLKIGLIDEITTKVPVKKDVKNQNEWIVNGVTYNYDIFNIQQTDDFVNMHSCEEVVNEQGMESKMTENAVEDRKEVENVNEELTKTLNEMLKNHQNVDTQKVLDAINSINANNGQNEQTETKEEFKNEESTDLVAKERERIQKIYSFSNTIEKDLLDRAVNEGLMPEQVTLKAIEEGKLINKSNFAEHLKGVENAKDGDIINVAQDQINTSKIDYFEKLNAMNMAELEEEYKRNMQEFAR